MPSEAGPPRLRSLDGLRAISILLVVYGHARATDGFPRTQHVHDALYLGDVSQLGVRTFFVISGFLITSLLAAEQARTGTISVRSFYLKRVFRIFPAYYAYLAAIGALALLGFVALSSRDAILALTYTVNYAPSRGWFVGHAWSLSVEEQFYLLWPLVFWAAGPRRGLAVAVGTMAVVPAIRVGLALALPHDRRALISEAFPTVADSIATGCALALLRPRLDASDRYRAWIRSPFTALGLGAVCFAAFCLIERHAWIRWALLESLTNLSLALMIDRFVRYPDGPVGRALNWRPIAFVGLISYSLYLWQQPFLAGAVAGQRAPIWQRFPQNLALAAAAALASYYLIEKPVLRLRERVMARGAPAPPAAAEREKQRAA